MDAPWRIELLGWLRAIQGDRTVARFQTQKTGFLLAYLAYYSHRSHPREVLIEQLWPEGSLEAGRNKLRMALTSLRRQLEPPGVPAGAVIVASRTAVQLNPAACVTDVALFEASLQTAARAATLTERAQRLEEAAAQYRGELLPGFFEEWVLSERQRLAGAYVRSLEELIVLTEEAGDPHRAIPWARRAVAADPLREEAQHRLIHLLLGTGQKAAALQQYQELERLLAQELGTVPDPATLSLLDTGTLQRSASSASTGRAGAPASRQTAESDPPSARGNRSPTPLLTVSPPHLCPPSPLPTGTVTFLLAEVILTDGREPPSETGSRRAVEATLEQLRPLFRGYGGHEMPAAREMLAVVFGRATDALSAAVTGLKAAAGDPRLADGDPASQDVARDAPSPLPGPCLRMALHLGEVEPGEEALRSPALPRATRLLLAAHPGQILLSEETASLLRHELMPGVHMADLGFYQLREHAGPQRLFQVEYPDMPTRQFPPPDAPPAPAGQLPLQMTRFIGRKAEMARLQALLPRRDTSDRRPAADAPADYPQRPSQDAGRPLSLSETSSATYRLVTLTGPGGSGKTRLALEAARRLREEFRGAVWFVPLADLTDARLIVDEVLDVLQPPGSHHGALSPRHPSSARALLLDPWQQIVAHLSQQPALLILDNFEHLVNEGAAVVQALLERAPTLLALVTSRQRLDLAGEREFPVPPLEVPDVKNQVSGVGRSGPDTRHPTPDTLVQYSSVALFVDRAQAVRPDFQITEANAAAVAGLCARLEGLPLALELAAARAGVLSPQQMLTRLEQRFDLLVSRQRDVVPRHRSLRATLDWSYQLLPPELQRFFARLSVFRGGWTIEAAEAVCGGEDVRPLAVGSREEPGRDRTPSAEGRTPVLECLEQLRESSLVLVGEAGVGYSVFGVRSSEDPTPNTEHRTPNTETRFRLLETLREYAAEQLAPAEQAALSRRHAAYYLALVEQAQPALKGPDQQRWLERLEQEHDNLRAVLTWTRTSEEVETGLRLGAALWWFWSLRGYLTEGRERLAELLALVGAEARTASWAKVQACAGFLAQWQGDYAAAHALFRESLSLLRDVGDLPQIAFSLTGLGQVSLALNEIAAARSLCEEALPIWGEIDDEAGIAWCLNILGNAAAAQNDHGSARSLLENSLAHWRRAGDRWGIAWSLNDLGNVAFGDGQLDAARTLFEESLAMKRELGDKVGMAWSLSNLAMAACHQGDQPAARDLFRECLTLCLELGDRRGIATCLERLAALAAAETMERDRARWAARLLGAAAAGRATLGAHAPAPRQEREGLPASLLTLLGDTAFSAAWETGRSMSLEEAAAAALREP